MTREAYTKEGVKGIERKKCHSGRGLLGRMLALVVLSLMVLLPGLTLAQTGREFWFDVPEVNRGHIDGSGVILVYLHVTALGVPADVEISLPAEPGFKPIKFTVPATTTKTLQLTDPNSNTSNFTDADRDLSLFYNAKRHGPAPHRIYATENLGRVNKPEYIENVLGWAESDPYVAKPYLNRTKKGVYMKASATIMAYIEISVGWNMDLIALKGSNALGKKFIVPFQTDLWTDDSRYWGMREPPYNSFNIVATKDNTKIRIKVPHDVWLNGAEGEQAGVNIGRVLPAGEHYLWLNRGESSIIAPYAKHDGSPTRTSYSIDHDDERGNRLGYQTSRRPDRRLAGSIVEVMKDEGSGGDIVVLTRDDITDGPNPDYVADQLVPAVMENAKGEKETLGGTDFGIVQGVVGSPKNEYLYILGIENGTRVNVSGKGSYTLDEGEQESIRMADWGDKGVAVRADKPIMVFHMSGVEEGGQGQKGGAVIPALPQEGHCVGSAEVAFSRAKDGDYVFYLNLLAWNDPASPARSAIGGFELYKQSGSGKFERVTGSEKKLEDWLNNPANWTRFPNVSHPDPSNTTESRTAKWSYMRVNTDDDVGAGIKKRTAYQLVNRKNVFHLGVLNGSAGTDAFYGYFSDFKSIKAQVSSVFLDKYKQVDKAEGEKELCFGNSALDKAILDVPLSENFKYEWSADDPVAMNYLYNSDQYTDHQPFKPRMFVKGLNLDAKYTVKVSGMCDLEDTASFFISVMKVREPVFNVDPVVCVNGAGTPPVRIELKRLEGINKIKWFRKDVGSTTEDLWAESSLPADAVSVVKQLPVGYTGANVGPGGELLPESTVVRAEVWKNSCTWSFSRPVQVMRQPVVPRIVLDKVAKDCSDPIGGGYGRELTIKDGNASLAMAGQKYWIDYGDGNTEVLALDRLKTGEKHLFPARERDYTVKLYTQDSEESCRADAVDVVVGAQPVPQVLLTAGPPKFCSGSEIVKVENGSQMAKRYQWSYLTQEPGGAVVKPETMLGTGAQIDMSRGDLNGGKILAKGRALEYVFKLTAYNGTCEASDEASVTVLPNAEFTGKLSPKRTDPAASCGPYEYEYTATGASGVARYEWRWKRADKSDWQPFKIGGPVADGALEKVKIAFTNETSEDKEYEVQLATWAAEGGCGQEVKFEKVVVPPSFSVKIEGPRVEVCPDANGKKEVVLKNQTVGNASGIVYQWAIDGAPSSQAMPATEFRHTFTNADVANPKEFVVSLTARRGACTQKEETTVELYPLVAPRFSLQECDALTGAPVGPMVANGEYCSPLKMVGTAMGAAQYTWVTKFNGAVVAQSSGANYEYKYSNPGRVSLNLEVELKGTNAEGCSGSYSQRYVLMPAIDATIVAQEQQACAPDSRVLVTVPGKNRNPAGAQYELQGHDWEALSGNPRTDPDGTEIRYRMPGEYRLTLKVTNGRCSAIGKSSPIRILAGVQPQLEALAADAPVGCSPHSVELKPVMRSLDGATWVRWEFGDGEEDTKAGAVTHAFNATGPASVQYKVRLTAGNGTQCDARSKPAEVEVTVYPSPTGGGNVLASADPCRPQEWKVENLASVVPADEVVWSFTPLGAGGTAVERRGKPDGLQWDVVLRNGLSNDPVRYTYSQVAYKQWAGGPRCASQPATGAVVVGPTLQQRFDLAAPAGICGGGEVTFTDNTTGGKKETVIHSWTVDGRPEAHTKLGDEFKLELKNTTQARFDHVVRVETTQTTEDGRVCKRLYTPDFVVPVFPVAKASIAWSVVDRCAVPMVVRAQAAGVASDAACVWKTSAPQTMSSTGTGLVEFEFKNDAPEDDKEFTIELSTSQKWAGGPTCAGKAAPVKVRVPASPRAKADVVSQTRTKECGELQVKLDGSKSTGLSKPGSSYAWNFGNGTQGSGKTVSQTYRNVGFAGTDEKYTATLTVRNAEGCTDQVTLPFTVHPKVMARFTLRTDKLCTPFEATIENLSINADRYEWKLTNPDEAITPSDPMNFKYTFDNTSRTTTQTRSLELTAVTQHPDGVTCTGVSAPQSVTVPPRLEPTFKLTTAAAGCSPLEVKVENTTPNGMVVNGAYTWNWGDYHTETGTGPHSYTIENGDRAVSLRVPVSLEVSDGLGCRAKAAVQEVEVYPSVVADFSASPSEGCSPLEVEIVNTRPSPAYSYAWALGTQGTSSQMTPGKLTYENPHLDRAESQKEHLVLKTWLTAHPECKAQKDATIEVWPRVIAGFELSATEGCDPLEVTVKDKTQSAPGVRQYVWEASDGQRWLAAEPTFTFRNESRTKTRTIDLSVRVNSAQGCGDTWKTQLTVHATPTSGFEIEGAARGCSPFALALKDKAEGKDLQYTYDFGDGKVLRGDYAGQRMEHVYSNMTADPAAHVLVQRVKTLEGCWAETSQQVFVNPQVTADYGIQPGTSGCSPFEVQMTNHSINATRYEWEYGDGGISAQENPAHQYVNISPQDVTHKLFFVAHSDYGCSDTVVQDIMVYASPSARFEATPPAQLFPSTRVSVDNQSQPLVNGWDYHWAWGDGQSSQGVSPDPHVYEIWGDPANDFIIPIVLTVTNGHCKSVARKEVIIRAPKPMVEFTANRMSGCPPLEVQMLNSTKYATSSKWYFDDGTEPSTDPEPRHVFDEPGSYHVRLVAEGPGGTQEQFLVFEVFQRPVVEFKVEPERVFLPGAEVQALNLSVDAHSFRWDFGDGATSLDESPRHTYEAPGRYNVKLTGLSQQGCEGSKVIEDAVFVDGSGRIRFPTAFHPTGQGGEYGPRDHHNAVFHPFIEGSVQDYRLMVFTRWGEKIFQTTDVNKGWDGYFNGTPCATGVYAWRAVGTFYDGSVFDVKGSVTLLR